MYKSCIYCNVDNLVDLIGKDYKCADYEEILETACLLSGNDPEVIECLEYALDDPKGYFESLPKRSVRWSWDFPENFSSLYDTLFYMMIFELEEHGYLTEVRWKCRLEGLLSELIGLRNYGLIEGAVEKAADQFMTGCFIEDYCGEINEAADGKAYICRIPYFKDNFECPLIIVDAETLEKVQNISEYNKKLIEPYPNKVLSDPLAEFFNGFTPENGEKLLEAARLLSCNDEQVVEAVSYAVQNLKRYYYRNLGGYENFSVYMEDIADDLCYDWKPEPENLLFLSMINELFQSRYTYWIYCKTASVDFLKNLKKLRNYELIENVIPGIKFNNKDNVTAWCSAVDKALGGKARLCCIKLDIPEKDYFFPIIIADNDTFEKVKELMPDMFWDI